MEFKEFVRQYKRMCDTFKDGCEGCAIGKIADAANIDECEAACLSEPKAVEAVVSAWVASHPEQATSDKRPVRVVVRPAKAGEWIMAIKDCKSIPGDDCYPKLRFRIGEILRVVQEVNPVAGAGRPGVVFGPPRTEPYVIRNDEYVVLEEYKPEDTRVREVNRPARDGEYVRIDRAYKPDGFYANGDILRAQNPDRFGDFRIFKDGTRNMVISPEYTVLEGYRSSETAKP